MSHKADQLTVRVIVAILLIIAILVVVGVLLDHMPPLASIFTFPERQQSLVVPISTRTPRVSKKLSAKSETRLATLEPEVQRALPIEHPPNSIPVAQIITVPREISVYAVREKWTPVIEISPGFASSVTFSLGRMRIERNGQDIGVWFRKPVLKGRRVSEDVYAGSVDPFAMLDRTPRTIHFDRNTRTLRFLSLEKKGENVSVTFCP